MIRARVPVNDKIVEAAKKLLKKPSAGPAHAQLRKMVNGKVKSIDVDWWRKVNGVAPRQVTAKAEKSFQNKLAGIEAMADPARNSNEPQRQEAEKILARVRAAGPPKAPRMPSAPGLEEYDLEQARLQAELDRMDARMWDKFKTPARKGGPMGNTATKLIGTTRPKPSSVNTTKSQATKATPIPVNTTRTKPTAKPVNTTAQPKSAAKPVNTTTPKRPRTADRHLEPNRDRHRPGYMAEYMRRRRAAEREGR
jgi:hypothetical protein